MREKERGREERERGEREIEREKQTDRGRAQETTVFFEFQTGKQQLRSE